jgi:pilus biogenesis lipoprotein CpaD
MKKTFLPVVALMGGVAVLLAACQMTTPSMISTAPITVEEKQNSVMLPIDDLTPAAISELSKDYRRDGQGAVEVIVLYPAGGSEVLAENEAGRIAATLRDAGIGQVTPSSLPIDDMRKAGQVIVRYTQLVAHAPAGCDTHPADSRGQILGSDDGYFPNYRFGCGIDSYIAGQVARPSDLLGDDDIAPAEASRPTAQGKEFRDGKPVKDLKGTNASELSTK